MAEIQPLRALHYDTRVAGDLASLTAPPYDVIDEEGRAALIARSPYNVVAIDLPQGGDDPYQAAADLLTSWELDGAVVRDAEPALWAHAQTYRTPDGATHTRRGFFARVRVEDYGAGRIRPHERTHPGPKEDRLRLTRATRTNLSPIFSLYSDPTGAARDALAPFVTGPAWGDVTDSDGTRHELWRVGDPAAIAAVQEATRTAELLIADGHHRYETSRTYAEEIGGEGDHRYVLMCLVAMEDPGLTVLPTHRLVRGLDDARWQALTETLERDFELTDVERGELEPPAGAGPLTFGYLDARDRRPRRAVLRDQAIADAALADHAEPYRHLDTGVLEALLLKGALSLSDDDISHLHDFGYARDVAQAVSLVEGGEYDAAFILRPSPVTQVRDVAASGESMPPKSTYFFPKLLTGLLFNPLS